jgi:3-oxoacyl-[acyl-carrier-protein] synthase III
VTYIHGIEYAAGEKSPIETIESLRANQTYLDRFHKNGVKFYRKSAVSHIDLTVASVEKTLAAAGMDRSDLDAVIFASDTVHYNPAYLKEVGLLPGKLGIKDTFLYGVYLNACSNVNSAIELAQGLMLLKGFENILIITADIAGRDGRILPGGIAVLSDGAASFILSISNGPLRIVSLSNASNSVLFAIDAEKNQFGYIAGMIDCIKNLLKKTYLGSGVGPDDVGMMLTNNYSRSIFASFGAIAELPGEKVFTENLEDFAHCYSADIWINAKSCLDQGRLARHALVLTLSAGQGYFGSMLLEKT